MTALEETTLLERPGYDELHQLDAARVHLLFEMQVALPGRLIAQNLKPALPSQDLPCVPLEPQVVAGALVEHAAEREGVREDRRVEPPGRSGLHDEYNVTKPAGMNRDAGVLVPDEPLPHARPFFHEEGSASLPRRVDSAREAKSAYPSPGTAPNHRPPLYFSIRIR